MNKFCLKLTKLWPVKGAKMKIFEKLFYPQMGLHMKAILPKNQWKILSLKKFFNIVCLNFTDLLTSYQTSQTEVNWCLQCSLASGRGSGSIFTNKQKMWILRGGFKIKCPYCNLLLRFDRTPALVILKQSVPSLYIYDVVELEMYCDISKKARGLTTEK